MGMVVDYDLQNIRMDKPQVWTQFSSANCETSKEYIKNNDLEGTISIEDTPVENMLFCSKESIAQAAKRLKEKVDACVQQNKDGRFPWETTYKMVTPLEEKCLNQIKAQAPSPGDIPRMKSQFDACLNAN